MAFNKLFVGMKLKTVISFSSIESFVVIKANAWSSINRSVYSSYSKFTRCIFRGSDLRATASKLPLNTKHVSSILYLNSELKPKKFNQFNWFYLQKFCLNAALSALLAINLNAYLSNTSNVDKYFKITNCPQAIFRGHIRDPNHPQGCTWRKYSWSDTWSSNHRTVLVVFWRPMNKS